MILPLRRVPRAQRDVSDQMSETSRLREYIRDNYSALVDLTLEPNLRLSEYPSFFHPGKYLRLRFYGYLEQQLCKNA